MKDSFGIYVAFEGDDLVGKSTQARMMSDKLNTTYAIMPGGTSLGMEIRSLVLSNKPEMNWATETLLMTADRAQLYSEVILRARISGKVLITDRSIYSGMAYQGYGSDRSPDDVADLFNMSCAAINDMTHGIDPEVAKLWGWPDIVFLITASEEFRRSASESRGRSKFVDRFDNASIEFRAKLAHGFDEMAKANPDVFLRYHCTSQTKEQVHQDLLGMLEKRFVDLRSQETWDEILRQATLPFGSL